MIAGPRVADALARGPNASGLSALTALLASGLVAALLLARLGDRFDLTPGPAALLITVGVWSLVAAGFLSAWVLRAPPWPVLLRLAPRANELWIAAAALVLVVPFTFVHRGSLSVLPLC